MPYLKAPSARSWVQRRLLLLLLGSMLGLICGTTARAAQPTRVTVDVREADLHNVLRLLARAGNVNIVVSDSVKGRVTLHLIDVPWPMALETILRTQDLGLERVGEVLLIDTLPRISQRALEQGKAQREAESQAPLVTALLPLSYANAAQLAPVVTPLLSPRGQLSVDVRTNSLVVTDSPEVVAFLKTLLFGAP